MTAYRDPTPMMGVVVPDRTPWYEELAAALVKAHPPLRLHPDGDFGGRPRTETLFPSDVLGRDLVDKALRRLEPKCGVCRCPLTFRVTRSPLAAVMTVRSKCHGMVEEREFDEWRVALDRVAFIAELARPWFTATDSDPAWKGWQP